MKRIFAFLSLYISLPFARADDLLIDGGFSGWDENSWRVTVDGVMGGRSTGSLRFDKEDGVPTTMVFSGYINNKGGGFSSVRRWFWGNNNLDLSSYAGIAVEVEPLEVPAQQIRAPLGLHLQLHDTSSDWGFASAFAIPLQTIDDESTTSTTTIFLPMESFDRASRMGWQCRRRCSLDTSSINGMDIYVLFQEGNFEVKVKSVTAVRDLQSYQSPNVEFESSEQIVNFLYATIRSGSSLYNKDYRELCNSIYWSLINSIEQSSSSAVTPALKHVARAGLQETSRIAEEETNVANRKQDIAWTLRYTMDAMLADLEGVSRSKDHEWLPSVQTGITDNEENQTSGEGLDAMLADLEGASRSKDHEWLSSVQTGITDNEENQTSGGEFTSRFLNTALLSPICLLLLLFFGK